MVRNSIFLADPPFPVRISEPARDRTALWICVGVGGALAMFGVSIFVGKRLFTK